MPDLLAHSQAATTCAGWFKSWPLCRLLFADDHYLRRFLRARKHNIAKAKQMFQDQLEWRQVRKGAKGGVLLVQRRGRLPF